MTTRSLAGTKYHHTTIDTDADGYEVIPQGAAIAIGIREGSKKIITPRQYKAPPVVLHPVPSVTEITDEIKKAISLTLRQMAGKSTLMDAKERAGIVAQLSRSMNLLVSLEKLDNLNFDNMDDAALAAAAESFLKQLTPQEDN